MKLQTQFTVPNKKLKDLDYVKKVDFLDKFFDLCREYQQEIPPQKMAEILREYANRLDEWEILADLRWY